LTSDIIIVTSHRVSESLGGVERFVMSFSSWCNKNDIPVKVISRSLSLFSVKVSDGQIAFKKTNAPVSVKKIQLPYILYSLFMSIFSFLAFVTLLNLVKNSRLSGKDVIVHCQDLNFAAVATVLAGKLLSYQTILHQHGPYFDMLSGYSKKIEQVFNMFTCRLCSEIIVTDNYTQSYVARVSGRRDCITVIPATVDASKFKNLNKPVSDTFTVGYVGRLSPEKNVRTLLISFKEFRALTNCPCKLLIIGDGPLRDELIHLSVKLGVKADVFFAGFQTEISKFLSDIDVFVLPSFVEGTPISLLEAMAAGKAIIASNLPSIRGIIAAGQDGLLFNPNSSDALTNSLLIFYNNPDLRKKLIISANKKVCAFDENFVFNKILKTYSLCY